MTFEDPRKIPIIDVTIFGDLIIRGEDIQPNEYFNSDKMRESGAIGVDDSETNYRNLQKAFVEYLPKFLERYCFDIPGTRPPIRDAEIKPDTDFRVLKKYYSLMSEDTKKVLRENAPFQKNVHLLLKVLFINKAQMEYDCLTLQDRNSAEETKRQHIIKTISLGNENIDAIILLANDENIATLTRFNLEGYTFVTSNNQIPQLQLLLSVLKYNAEIRKNIEGHNKREVVFKVPKVQEIIMIAPRIVYFFFMWSFFDPRRR